ncbi:T9SS type A sorting domain-containing protein, partial [Lentimicrobium sp.]
NELLGAIMFTSQNCGYACGNNNTILKYTVISGLEEQGGMEAGGQGGVEVFPNPGRGIYSLQFSNYNLQSVRVEIVDLYGKAVTINNNRTIEQLNDSALEIDITNLPSGIYIIRIHLVNQIIVKKIIKL